MINWRELTKDEQIAALQNVAGAKHIPPQAVEKDLWVTTILQIVFSLPFADSLVFNSSASCKRHSASMDLRNFQPLPSQTEKVMPHTQSREKSSSNTQASSANLSTTSSRESC